MSDVHMTERDEGPPSPKPPQPAVPVRQSLRPDEIVCLDCGFKGKMLKRHLGMVHRMTPEQYRARWGLPADYPMTAPNHSKERSRLAKATGMGRGPLPLGLRPVQPPQKR